MKFNKLVRDKIPEIIKTNGQNPITHIADENEYRQYLKNKLVEEVEEFLEDENEEEFADILEVIEAVYKFKKFDKVEVEKKKQEKYNQRGGFEEKIILEAVS